MKTILLVLAILISSDLCAPSTRAQTPSRFKYSNYNPVTKGAFANFTFPAGPVFRGASDDDGRKSFTLKNGIFEPKFDARGYIVRLGTYLKSVNLADVTGDGRKEAIVVVGNLCDCSGVWFGVYIYRLAGLKPGHLLWSFQTGDRAAGGLRQVSGRDGRLVVETFGPGSGPERQPNDDPDCMVCAREYTRREYAWIGNHFVQRGKSRVFPVT
jgi:hypothetical protein